MRGEGTKSQIVETNAVGLGGNEFENGKISVESGRTIPKGVLLKRIAGGNFEVLTDFSTETPVAINPFDFKNESPNTTDMSIRPIIFGRVRADLLNINGTSFISTPNAGHIFDKIRANTLCIPIQGTDISRTE